MRDKREKTYIKEEGLEKEIDRAKVTKVIPDSQEAQALMVAVASPEP